MKGINKGCKPSDAIKIVKETVKLSETVVVQGGAPDNISSSLATTSQQEQLDKIVAGSTPLTTQDLLPVYDSANEFAQQNPVSKLLQEQNFLQAGYHTGINTTIQSK